MFTLIFGYRKIIYVIFVLQDYPSVSQISNAVVKTGVKVIFAVTANQLAHYRALSDAIPGTLVGELTTDSSNIIHLVGNSYEVILPGILVCSILCINLNILSMLF